MGLVLKLESGVYSTPAPSLERIFLPNPPMYSYIPLIAPEISEKPNFSLVFTPKHEFYSKIALTRKIWYDNVL
jgi:hypothetical protein